VSLIAPTVATDGVATFEAWSDGAPRSRTLVMPDRDVTFAATYLTPIDRRYAADAAVRELLGAPADPEAGDESLRYRAFAGGRLYWTPDTGVHEVHGDILRSYLAAGGPLQYGPPLTDESTAPDGIGRYSQFGGGSIYWTPTTGAHLVYGAIRDRWAALGAERSYLGYPVSDEYPVPGGRRSDFEHGSLTWDATTGQVTDLPR
jgi:uncharacterized protein with LGFP repeats